MLHSLSSDPPDKYAIAVYGQPPPIHIPCLNGISRVDDVDKTLVAREEAIKMLKFYLLRAQNRMKQQADKGREDIHDFVKKDIKKRNVAVVYTLVQWVNGPLWMLLGK
nr:retrotransposon-related protein [Tanacetum cinerariifolium]